jgi:hypothetical protein
MAGAKADDIYANIVEMFSDLSDGLERADRERAILAARLNAMPTNEQTENATKEREGNLRAAILSDLHRINAENKAGFRKELDEALDAKLPAMVAAEIERRDVIQREKNEARWTRIRSRAQTIIAIVSLATASWALLELFARD